jgi:hypothetical protein
MTFQWNDARSILQHVKEATDKLYEIEITPKIKQVLPVISQIVDFAGRFDELTTEERHQVDHLLWQLKAYVYVGNCVRFLVQIESESFEDDRDIRREIRERRQLVEIGTDFFCILELDLPPRLEEDLVDDITMIVELCKSKPITFNLIPLEIAPVISTLKDITIPVKRSCEFETALVGLETCGISSDLSLTFRELSLETPITVLAVNYVTKLFKSQNVTVIYVIQNLSPEH